MMPVLKRAFKPERIADGEHPLADQEVRRTAEGHREERLGRGVDLQHGHVGFGVAADEPGVVGVAVEKGDVDFAGAVNHVEIGQHVALAVDHAAAPFALRLEHDRNRLPETPWC